MRAFDPAGLFEATREPGMPAPPYRHLADELDAVQRGDKAMSAFFWTRDYITRDGDFVARAEAIFDRGLALVLDPHEDQRVTAFALHTDELWRVPAWRAYSDARHGSSEA